MDEFQFPLGICREGESVTVHAVDADTTTAARLQAMGICGGAPVQVLRKGSPMIIRVGDSRLCLRAEEVAQIMVTPVSSMFRAEFDFVSTGNLTPADHPEPA